jgi:ethanolamine utilization microcompartment shell protein EutL
VAAAQQVLTGEQVGVVLGQGPAEVRAGIDIADDLAAVTHHHAGEEIIAFAKTEGLAARFGDVLDGAEHGSGGGPRGVRLVRQGRRPPSSTGAA